MPRYHVPPKSLVLQVHTFNIGIYPGAILPFIIGYWADAATAVGDITATEEASGIETIGPEHDKRIQGCLLADGESLYKPDMGWSPCHLISNRDESLHAYLSVCQCTLMAC